MSPDELRDAWIRLTVGAGIDPDFAEDAYDCAHRIGRGAGRLEALEQVRETGSVTGAIDAFGVLNEAELILSEATDG